MPLNLRARPEPPARARYVRRESENRVSDFRVTRTITLLLLFLKSKDAEDASLLFTKAELSRAEQRARSGGRLVRRSTNEPKGNLKNSPQAKYCRGAIRVRFGRAEEGRRAFFLHCHLAAATVWMTMYVAIVLNV